MLSLLCGSPDVVDSPFYDSHSRRPSRVSISRLGRSGSKTKKKRVLKGSIGVPTAFRHEGHVGADNMMSPTGAWDVDQWRAELEKHMQAQPRSRSEPTSSVTSPVISPANSVMASRRKPVPSLLPPPRERQGSLPASSAGSSPIRTVPIDREQSRVSLV